MQDDLFELGGDSLMLVRVLSEIRDQYDLVIPLADVLNEPTAAALAALVERPRGRRDAADLLQELASLPAGDMLALLTEVESMSPDQVTAALGA
jgi:aryl carrier-like protein